MLNRFDFQRFEASTETIAGEEKSCWKFLDATSPAVHIICNNAEGKEGLEGRFLGDEALTAEYYKTLSGITKIQPAR